MPPEIAFLRERPREDALEPTGSLEPLDLRVVQEVIGPQGTLSEVIAGFERRRQQEQMADAVAEAINVNGQILVEAGTGTGKSLAYLVPAALSATERGETVVLSTNTLALQDQLLRKDVPDLIAALTKADGERQVERRRAEGAGKLPLFAKMVSLGATALTRTERSPAQSQDPGVAAADDDR